MRKRPVEQAWRNVLTLVALAATLMALYLQIVERKTREEEARLAAVRLEDALAESQARLRAEVLAEPRAELQKDDNAARLGAQPIPDTVLRRRETGGDTGGALGQALAAFRPQEALVIARLGESLESLSRQMEASDRILQRELEELRAAALRAADVASKTAALMLLALVCLIAQLLPSLWPRARRTEE